MNLNLGGVLSAAVLCPVVVVILVLLKVI